MSFTRSGGTPPPWYTAVPVVQVSANYTAKVGDYYIGVNGQNVTVTLPLGSALWPGKTYVVKDESGKAGKFVSWQVAIASTSPNRIDGDTSAVLALNYGSISILWTGSAWSIF